MSGKKYGWVSAEGRDATGAVYIYKMRDGTTMEVTVVGDSDTVPPSSFGDEFCVGEVESYAGSREVSKKKTEFESFTISENQILDLRELLRLCGLAD